MSTLRFGLACWCATAMALLLSGCTAVPGVKPVGGQNPAAINHIILLVQENRSFDHYFGQLRQYWAQNGYPDQSFDGLPQFNPASGIAPLQERPRQFQAAILRCQPVRPASPVHLTPATWLPPFI